MNNKELDDFYDFVKKRDEELRKQIYKYGNSTTEEFLQDYLPCR